MAGSPQHEHYDGAHQHVDDQHDGQREVHRARELAGRVAHRAGRVGHHAEPLEGHVQQAGAEQHPDRAVPAGCREVSGMRLGQPEDDEDGEDDKLHGDHQGLRSPHDLGSDQVDQDHRRDQAHRDALHLPSRSVAREEVAGVPGEAGRVQAHGDHPAEELEDVQPAGDDPVAEAVQQELGRPAPARKDGSQAGIGVHREQGHNRRDDEGQRDPHPGRGRRQAHQGVKARPHHPADPDGGRRHGTDGPAGRPHRGPVSAGSLHGSPRSRATCAGRSACPVPTAAAGPQRAPRTAFAGPG